VGLRQLLRLLLLLLPLLAVAVLLLAGNMLPLTCYPYKALKVS
jgi:hypothetical protein